MKPVQLIFEPLKDFPRTPTKFRKSSQFKCNLEQTYKLLKLELSHLGVERAIIQVQCGYEWIRNDGLLHAKAQVPPAVVVSFTTKAGKSLMYPCDTFAHYTENLRAIALSLEALRKIDRYGVTSKGEQYTGFQALPPPSHFNDAHTCAPGNKQQAWAIIKQHVETVLEEPPTNAQILQSLIRSAEQKTHPDVGGDRKAFERVQQARKVLLDMKA